jgi:DNA repair protein RadC
MSERLYQKRFDEFFHQIGPQEVTPTGFAGLPWPDCPESRPQETTIRPGRFVQEARTSVQIGSPGTAAAYLQQHIYQPFAQFDQEEVWVLLLNTKNRVTHEVMVYRGTVNTAYIRPVEFFKEAVRVNASSLILSHCHPSTDPTPSPEDVKVTKAANEIARLLEIELLDHIIVGGEQWVSLKERGLGFD